LQKSNRHKPACDQLALRGGLLTAGDLGYSVAKAGVFSKWKGTRPAFHQIIIDLGEGDGGARFQVAVEKLR